MKASLRRTTSNGFDVVVLENSNLRAVVIPALGGRVWELRDVRRDRQWIWHREDVPLAASPRGSNYDEAWAGGWEELFPNDAPGRFEGRDLPDHGEWWSTQWTISHASEGEEAVLRLESEMEARRVSCIKELRLGAVSDTMHVSYRIVSRETEPFHFLFKQHLPVAPSPACSLTLPGGRVTAVDPSFGTILRAPGPFDWPAPEGETDRCDLRIVPPRSSRAREFVYVADIPHGSCGVDDREAGASLRMQYDQRQMPYVWLFLSYGGWRDCYTAVLEPCTNMPKDLDEASRRGQSARLMPGGTFETEVAVSLTALLQ